MAELSQFARPSVWGRNDCFDFAVALVSDIIGTEWKWRRPKWVADAADAEDALRVAAETKDYASFADGIAHVLGLCGGSRFSRVDERRAPLPGDIAIVRLDDGKVEVVAVCDRDYMWKHRHHFGVAPAIGEVIAHYRMIIRAKENTQ